MEKTIVIYDSDSMYAIRFMEYVKRRGLDFDVLVFTKEESFAEYIGLHPIEILLLDEMLSVKEEQLENISHLYILSEQPLEAGEQGNQRIFKYQSAEAILTKILTDYTKKEKVSGYNSEKNDRKVISVVSFPPGRNKLSFSWSLAYLLAERRKVLFIPMELLPIPFLTLTASPNSNLSEFIYYLKDNNTNAIDKMNPLLCCVDRLSYLSGLSHGLDLLSVTKEDIRRWLGDIRNSTDYGTVVFYLGCYSEAAVEIISQSDKVLVAMEENGEDAERIKELDRQLQLLHIPTGPDRFQKLLVPDPEWEGRAITMQELKNSESWLCAMPYADHL